MSTVFPKNICLSYLQAQNHQNHHLEWLFHTPVFLRPLSLTQFLYSKCPIISQFIRCSRRWHPVGFSYLAPAIDVDALESSRSSPFFWGVFLRVGAGLPSISFQKSGALGNMNMSEKVLGKTLKGLMDSRMQLLWFQLIPTGNESNDVPTLILNLGYSVDDRDFGTKQKHGIWNGTPGRRKVSERDNPTAKHQKESREVCNGLVVLGQI